MNKEEALASVRNYLVFKGAAPSTIKMYNFFLNRFFTHLGGKSLVLVTVHDCMDYISMLKESGTYADSTLNLIISCMRFFFEVTLERPLTHRQFPSITLVEKEIVIFSEVEI